MKLTELPAGILFDVDGTVTDANRKFSNAVVRAMHQVKARGIERAPATGRGYWQLPDITTAFGLDGWGVLAGGGTVVKDMRTGEVHWTSALEIPRVKDIVSSIGDLCTRLQFGPHDHSPLPSDFNANSIAEPAPWVFATFLPSQATEVTGRLQEIGIDTELMDYTRDPSQRCVQIKPPGVNKGTGAKIMFDATGYNADDPTQGYWVAMGNDVNDVPLRNAIGPNGILVALKGSPPELIAVADWVTKGGPETAFPEAMQHLGLIPK